eukprot:4038316-Lingulodinium_polyedra.AAC.1
MDTPIGQDAAHVLDSSVLPPDMQLGQRRVIRLTVEAHESQLYPRQHRLSEDSEVAHALRVG